jgi:hypothetical protein
MRSKGYAMISESNLFGGTGGTAGAIKSTFIVGVYLVK